MNYTLFFPTPLNEINMECDNIDVFISLEIGQTYTLVAVTPDGLNELMKQTGKPFVEPGVPFCIVARLTEENIRLFVEELLEDESLLKLYGSNLA